MSTPRITAHAIARHLLDHIIRLRTYDKTQDPAVVVWCQPEILEEVTEIAVRDAYMEVGEAAGRRFRGTSRTLAGYLGLPSGQRLTRLTAAVAAIIAAEVAAHA